MSFIKNYLSSFTIIFGIIIGGCIGYFLGQSGVTFSILGHQFTVTSTDFKPFGQLFLNMVFVTIVPLVFFSITSSITKTSQGGRLKKILLSALFVFLSTATIVAILSYFGFMLYNPLNGMDLAALIQDSDKSMTLKTLSFSEMLVNTLSAGDFLDLFRRTNLLALIIFSLLLGSAIVMSGEKGKPIITLLNSGLEVILKLVKIIMYMAPIGLGCYFADIVGELGPRIVGAYAQMLLLYFILTIIIFFGLNSMYAFLAGGAKGFRLFWKTALTPSLTAMATTSSAACIPVNLIAVKEMNVPDDIAETIVPLGANTHKDGSVMGGVFKILFLLALIGINPFNVPLFFAVIAVALLVGVVIGAIPSGGLTAEVLICSLFGVPVDYVGIILVVSIIIDIPATLLNSTGNNACVMLITRIVEGKDWIKD